MKGKKPDPPRPEPDRRPRRREERAADRKSWGIQRPMFNKLFP